MAFYKDAPNHHTRKTNYASQGSWDDEGTHYRGAARRFGPDVEENKAVRGQRHSNNDRKDGYQTGYRDGRASFGGEKRGHSRPGYGENHRDEGFRNARGDAFKGGNTRGGNRTRTAEAAPAKSYRDFEHRAPVVKPAPRAIPVSAPAAVPELPPENLLSGRNPIREAIRSGRDIEKLLVQRGELSGSAREIVQMAREAHIVVQEVDKSRLDEITPHHQGMLAYASAYQYSTVDAMLETAKERGEEPFLILLDGVTDPHNLGAIIRTAECVGAHGVIVPERRSVGLTPAAVKASAGAVEHMKVARVTNLNRTIEELKKHGVWAYAVTMDGEDYQEVDFHGGVALVIGAEGEGISRLTLENCDYRVSLPLEGSIDSLNASVAAGVMMYRVLASRKA